MKATSPATPNLTAQKAVAHRSATAKKFHVIYTASEISARPMNDPIRIAYTAGGDPAVRAYLAQQKAAHA